MRESQCEETEAEVAWVAGPIWPFHNFQHSNKAHADLAIDWTCTLTRHIHPTDRTPFGPGDTPIEARLVVLSKCDSAHG